VWFDALPNYLTATGFPDKQYRDLWPEQLHVIGKDITRLHCVVWPAMLQAAEIAIPEHVWAHGFMTFGGERFSKSAGVAFSLDQAIDRHGPDALRYFLLREIPFDGDGDFSWERFDERYNSELANAWGNLASRVIAMVEKYREGVVPHGERTSLDNTDLTDLAEYHSALDGSRGYFLQEGVKRALASVTRGNEFVQSSQPWALAKDESKSAALDDVLASVIRGLARQCVLLHPFVPGKTEELWRQLGAPGRVSDQRFDGLAGLDVAGWKVRKGASLFPREQSAAAGTPSKK
jgi:methionyl-tRNA synthetase